MEGGNKRYSVLRDKKWSLLAVLFLMACSPAIRSTITERRPPLAHDGQVYVFHVNQDLPKGATKVGDLFLGTTFYSKNCGYDKMLDRAKMEARTNGANIVKVTRHLPPGFLNSCRSLKVVLCYLEGYRPTKGSDISEPLHR